MAKTEYIIVYDKSLDFCRLFRTDAEEIPAGCEILWRGIGLRRGYDEMIRQNRNRKGVEVYRICARINRKGEEIYRIFKTSPRVGWSEKQTASSYKEARSVRSRLIAERDAKTASALAMVGRPGNSGGNLTRTDRLYLNWISENRMDAANDGGKHDEQGLAGG